MGRSDTARQLPLPNVLFDASNARSLASLHERIQALRPLQRTPPPVPSEARSDIERVHLERRLTHAVGAPLTLSITDNRHTMLSIRRREGVGCVRLHQMFLDAPPVVIDAVGRYLADADQRSCVHIDQYIAANRWRIRGPQHAHREAPTGAVYNLISLRDSLAQRYFGQPVDVAIAWGRSATGLRDARSRTIRMGTYYVDERLIRIHPALDQAWVPEYFVAWVIYHEMLHHIVPMPFVNGRRCYHTQEFRERERLFADEDRARQWERWNLHRLIASRDH